MEGIRKASDFELRIWLEGVLKRYCTQLLTRKTPTRGSSIFVFEKPEDEAKVIEPIKDLHLKITSLEFEKIQETEDDDDDEEEEKKPPFRTDELLKADIKYIIGADGVKRSESFLINITSAKTSKSDLPLLKKFIETDVREIEFYTKLIPTLEDWSFARGYSIDLACPICFYGQYLKADENEKSVNVNKADSINKNTTSSSWQENTSNKSIDKEADPDSELAEAMSILIINDLEIARFNVNDSKLSIGEVKATLRELAHIHALSWAYQDELIFDKGISSLLEVWPFLLQPSDAIETSINLVESGIEPLIGVLNSKLETSEAEKLVPWLNDLRVSLPKIFKKLLTPPQAPLPSTIIHLDLQYRNIAFRPKSKRLPSNKSRSSSSSPSSSRYKVNNLTSSENSVRIKESTSGTSTDQKYHDIECRISNWKIVSYGSPLHDLAFLFLTSLPPEVRKAASSKLIEYYYSIFQETVARFNLQLPFTSDTLKSEYKKYFFGAFLFVLGNFEEPPDEEDAGIDSTYPYFDNFVHALREVRKDGLTWD